MICDNHHTTKLHSDTLCTTKINIAFLSLRIFYSAKTAFHIFEIFELLFDQHAMLHSDWLQPKDGKNHSKEGKDQPKEGKNKCMLQ